MIKRFLSVLILTLCVSAAAFSAEAPIQVNTTVKEQPAPVAAAEPLSHYKEIAPLTLVNTPAKYLNKNVKLKAKFDKFSTIGLDYPPVKRDAKTYISFLIKRENANYNIPLSELKLIIKRDYAEKEMVNIEQGDDIEIYGNVFSTALGDPWVSVEKIVILTEHKDKDKDKENKDADKK